MLSDANGLLMWSMSAVCRQHGIFNAISLSLSDVCLNSLEWIPLLRIFSNLI